METEIDKYEKSFFFRLIRVGYILMFLGTAGISFIAGWYSKPTTEVNNKQSYITCSDGKKYSFDTVNLYAIPLKSQSLLSYDDSRAKEFCIQNKIYKVFSKSLNTTKEITYSEYLSYGLTASPDLGYYTFNIVEGTRGSWGSALVWWVLGITGSYTVLNLIRETLNYVFLGKHFDWLWLLVPIGLIALVASPDKKAKNIIS